jgi:hypothetical protein
LALSQVVGDRQPKHGEEYGRSQLVVLSRLLCLRVTHKCEGRVAMLYRINERDLARLWPVLLAAVAMGIALAASKFTLI